MVDLDSAPWTCPVRCPFNRIFGHDKKTVTNGAAEQTFYSGLDNFSAGIRTSMELDNGAVVQNIFRAGLDRYTSRLLL